MTLTNIILFDQNDIDEYTSRESECKSIQHVKIASSSILDRQIKANRIPELVESIESNGNQCYVGGGITDKAILEGTLKEHVKFLQKSKISTIELSNSVIKLKDGDFLNLVRYLKGEFRKVIVEIGTKEDDEYTQSSYKWHRGLELAMSSGANQVILEGGGGNVGIYNGDFKPKLLLLFSLIQSLDINNINSKLILEAQQYEHQEYFIKLFGSKISLGNIVQDYDGIENINFLRANLDNNNGLLKQSLELIDMIYYLCNSNNVDVDRFLMSDRVPYLKDLKDFEWISEKIQEKIYELKK